MQSLQRLRSPTRSTWGCPFCQQACGEGTHEGGGAGSGREPSSSRIYYAARRAAPVDGDGFQLLVAVVCRIRVPSTPGALPRIGRAVLSALADSSSALGAEISTQAQEPSKGRPLDIASKMPQADSALFKGSLISYVDTRFSESFSVVNHPVQ